MICMKAPFQRDSRGFTLIEMMVVISIMVILLAVAMPIYSRSVNQAKEDAFRQSLETLNKVIFQYTLDKQRPPHSLEDLVSAGYIKEVPNDITGSATWVVEDDPPALLSLYQTDTGIYGVRSGSDRVGSNGKPYSEW
jgi:general secretion pathway protein G